MTTGPDVFLANHKIRWLAKSDVVGQLQFVHAPFGIAA